MHLANIYDEDIWTKFIRSYFVSVGSMITVLAYTPENNIESLFVTIIMFINSGIFGYALNTSN